MSVHGIDIYEGDGTVNFLKVSAAGNHFVVQKISEGADFADSSATRKRVEAIRSAGMIAGGYHFLRPKRNRTGAVEARFFIERGKAIGLWARDHQRVIDIRPVLDVEVAGEFDLTKIGDRVRCRRYIRSAVAEIIKLTGHRPIIYTGGPFWRDELRNRRGYGCPLWLAAYTKSPTPWTPNPPWKRADLWQYTDQKIVPGVPGACDANVYLGGDMARFRRYMCF